MTFRYCLKLVGGRWVERTSEEILEEFLVKFRRFGRFYLMPPNSGGESL